MRADELAHTLSSRDSTSFRKDVGKVANSKVPLASKVENDVVSHSKRIPISIKFYIKIC